MSSGCSTATRKSSVASTLFKASSKFLHHNNNNSTNNNGSPKSVKRQKHSSSSDPEVCSSTDQSISNNLNTTHSSAATSSSADEDSSDVKLLLPISSSSSRSSNLHSSQGPAAGKLAAAAAGGGGGSGAGGKKRFVGVRQRPSGRWVAEIKDTTQKIRLWLGTFDSAEDGARAYDEAAWLLRGANTRTNFVPTCGSGASLQPGAVPASKAARLIRLRQIAAASKLGEFAASEVPEPKLVPEHHHHHHRSSGSSSSSSLLKGSSRSSTQDQLMNNRNQQQSITVVEPALNPSSEEDEDQFIKAARSPQKLVPEHRHHRRSGSLKGSRSSTQDHSMKNRQQQQSITVVVEPALNPPPSSDEEDQFKAASPQSEQKLVPEQLHRNLKGSNPAAGARSSTQEDQHVMVTQNRQQQPMIKVVEEEPLNHSTASEDDEEFIASDAHQSGSCDPASTSPHQPTGAPASSKPAELLQISCVRHHNVESDGEELPANDRRGRLKLEVGSIHLYPNSNDHSPVLKMESKQSLTSSSESHCQFHLPMNSDPQAEESSPLPSPKPHAHRNHCNDSQKEISNEGDHQLHCFTGCKSEAGTEVVLKTEGSSLVDTDQYNRSIYSSPTRLLESHRSITSELRSFAFSSIESFESYPPPSHSPLVSFSRHQFTGEHHPGAAAMVVVPVTPVHEAQDSLIAPHFQFSCATNRDHVSLYPSSDCKELSASLEDFGSLGVGAHHENHHHEASSGQLGHVMNSSGESVLNQSYNESEENDHCGRSGGIKVHHHHQVSTFSSEEVHYSASPDIEMYQRELDRSNLYPKSAIRREREYADLLPEHSWPEFVYMDDTEMHESAGFFGVDLSCENSGVYTSAFDFSAELAIDRDSCTSVLLEEQINHQLPPHDDSEVLTLHRMDYEQSMSTNPPTSSSFPKCVLLTEPSEMDYSLSSPAATLIPNPPLSPQEETHSLSISSSLLWRVAGSSSSGASPETLTGAEQSLSSDSAAGAGGGGECSTQDQALWSSMDLPPLCMVA